MSGPIPNREEDLARPRERKGSDEQSVKKGEARPTSVYHADKDWHPIAAKIWDAAKRSGQSDFYQQSDWAYLYSLCEDLSHFKKSGKRSAQMAQTIYSALGSLLLTEGDRRRARIELEDPPDDAPSAAVLSIAEYQRELGVES